MGRFLQSAAASALILSGMALTLSSCQPAQQRPGGMSAVGMTPVETIPADIGPPQSLPSGTARIPAMPTAAGVTAIVTEERGNEAAMTPTERPVSTRDALVALARQDLARRLGYGPEQADNGISIVRATAQEWPDASLGCPQPGMMYPQVITPGYQIILEAAGRQYDYRAPMRRDGPVRLCTPQKATAPARSR